MHYHAFQEAPRSANYPSSTVDPKPKKSVSRARPVKRAMKTFRIDSSIGIAIVSNPDGRVQPHAFLGTEIVISMHETTLRSL
jgi:hypothetical protein